MNCKDALCAISLLALEVLDEQGAFSHRVFQHRMPQSHNRFLLNTLYLCGLQPLQRPLYFRSVISALLWCYKRLLHHDTLSGRLAIQGKACPPPAGGL